MVCAVGRLERVRARLVRVATPLAFLLRSFVCEVALPRLLALPSAEPLFDVPLAVCFWATAVVCFFFCVAPTAPEANGTIPASRAPAATTVFTFLQLLNRTTLLLSHFLSL